MPANLTPQYLEAEARFRAARETQEKLGALEEMLALLPKHKGTEKMQADIRRRISKLRSETQKKGKAASRHADPFFIRREGAGQLVLLGPPNAGKSSLLARLTRASPEIAIYPFTTHKPLPGMMKFENVGIQLVDAPPVTDDYMEPGTGALLRSANVVVVVADLAAEDPIAPLEAILGQLENLHIALATSAPTADTHVKKVLWVANKSDSPTARDNLALLEEFLPRPWLPVSATTGAGTDAFAKLAFESLDVIRVYTKPPGKKPDFQEPTILKRGATVLDAAAAVHREFVHRLRFARLWKSEAEMEHQAGGIKVERDHELSDGDIVELHVERSV